MALPCLTQPGFGLEWAGQWQLNRINSLYHQIFQRKGSKICQKITLGLPGTTLCKHLYDLLVHSTPSAAEPELSLVNKVQNI